MRRKADLRELCRKAYGESSIEQYDKLCQGCPIGDIYTTIDFLEKIEKVKAQNKL